MNHTLHGPRLALSMAASLALVTGAAVIPASAAAFVPTCDGFTQAQAAALGYATFQGTSADETFVDTSGAWVWAWGGGGNDTIESGSGDDRICGGGGNDSVTTGDGLDSVYGDAGNDTIDLGPGVFDIARGGKDTDTINGGTGPDSIYGDDQPGALPSTVGADVLDGGPDDDDLFGGPGIDVLRGGSGTDRLFGDDGNDILKGGNGPLGELDEGDGGGGLSDRCVQLELPAVNCP
jgi:Ca2+-binding RTX toxin-like protein